MENFQNTRHIFQANFTESGQVISAQVYALISFKLTGIASSSFSEYELTFSIYFQVVSSWDSPVLAQKGIFFIASVNHFAAVEVVMNARLPGLSGHAFLMIPYVTHNRLTSHTPNLRGYANFSIPCTYL